MIIKDNIDKKIISLSKPFDSRPKVLNFIYSLTFLIPGLCLLLILLFTNDLGFTLNIILLFILCIFLIAGYRFINSTYKSERIIVTEKLITIEKGGIFKKSSNTYESIYIKKFRHLEKPEITKHPLAGESYDYLGFQTEQQVISEMHGDDRLAFDYNGKTITFGENMYSWHFEELVLLFQEITGNDFNYVEENE